MDKFSPDANWSRVLPCFQLVPWWVTLSWRDKTPRWSDFSLGDALQGTLPLWGLASWLVPLQKHILEWAGWMLAAVNAGQIIYSQFQAKGQCGHQDCGHRGSRWRWPMWYHSFPGQVMEEPWLSIGNKQLGKTHRMAVICCLLLRLSSSLQTHPFCKKDISHFKTQGKNVFLTSAQRMAITSLPYLCDLHGNSQRRRKETPCSFSRVKQWNICIFQVFSWHANQEPWCKSNWPLERQII